MTTKIHPVEELYRSRCAQRTDGKLTPHFWAPQPMTGQPLTLLADDRNPVEGDAALRCMQRLNALGLGLEIEVGGFIQDASRKELPDAPYLRELLKSNVSDEARHFQGFQFAAEAYGLPEDDTEAKQLAEAWVAEAERTHPLLLAATLETGVFLVTLGLMRLVGGSELNDLAFRVSEDESRHVKINRTLSRKLGLTPDRLPEHIAAMVCDTVAYAVGDLEVPLLGGLGLEFFLGQSSELISQGTAKKLDELTAARQHQMPFEISNKRLYSRETESGVSAY